MIMIQFFHVSRVMLFVILLFPQSHVTWSPQYLVYNVGTMPHGIIEPQLHNSVIFQFNILSVEPCLTMGKRTHYAFINFTFHTLFQSSVLGI
jgi:hypothetical protein